MGDVEILTQHAFSETGPVSWHPKCEYRAPQKEFAVHIAQSLDTGTLRPPRPDLYLTQIEPGAGKTLGYLVPHMFHILLTGNRLIVSTFTVDLRSQITEKDAVVAQEIVNMTLAAMPEYEYLANKPQLIVAERKSLRSYASLVTAQKLLSDPTATPQSMAVRQHYHDNVLAAFERGAAADKDAPFQDDFLLDLSDFLRSEDIPEDWLTSLDLLGVDLSLRESEIEGTNLPSGLKALVAPSIKKFIQQEKDNLSISGADIIVCTHAMFLWNNMMWGDFALRTSVKRGIRPISCVVDECDAMPNVSLQWTDTGISIKDISIILNQLNGRKKAVRDAKKAVDDVLVWARGVCRGNRQGDRPYVISAETGTVTQPGVAQVVEKAELLRETLTKITQLVEDTVTVRLQEKFAETLDFLTDLMVMKDWQGRATAEATRVELSGTRIFIGPSDHPEDRIIGLKPSRENRLPSLAWRNFSIHNYERIHFVSGTINPLVQESDDADFDTFMRRVGISTKKRADGTTLDVVRYKKAIACEHGAISKLVFASPGLGIDPAFESRAAFAAYLARVIELSMAETHVDAFRALVVFPSGDLKHQVYANMSDAAKKRIIMKAEGIKPHAYFGRFETMPDGVWFGHEWMGVNFVTDQGETMIHRVMVTQHPVAPSSPIKAIEQPRATFLDNRHDARGKFRQVLGRGIRKSTDRPELWSLDPRVQFPELLKLFGVTDVLIGKTDYSDAHEAIPKKLYRDAEIGIIMDPNTGAVEWEKRLASAA